MDQVRDIVRQIADELLAKARADFGPTIRRLMTRPPEVVVSLRARNSYGSADRILIGLEGLAERRVDDETYSFREYRTIERGSGVAPIKADLVTVLAVLVAHELAHSIHQRLARLPKIPKDAAEALGFVVDGPVGPAEWRRRRWHEVHGPMFQAIYLPLREYALSRASNWRRQLNVALVRDDGTGRKIPRPPKGAENAVRMIARRHARRIASTLDVFVMDVEDVLDWLAGRIENARYRSRVGRTWRYYYPPESDFGREGREIVGASLTDDLLRTVTDDQAVIAFLKELGRRVSPRRS